MDAQLKQEIEITIEEIRSIDPKLQDRITQHELEQAVKAFRISVLRTHRDAIRREQQGVLFF